MKLYYEAIRAMPEEWLDDQLEVVLVFGVIVVAVLPDRTVMEYRADTRAWHPVPVVEPLKAKPTHPAPKATQ